MFRALSRYFGAEPDLDIEAQRAIVVLSRPMRIEWQVVDRLVTRAGYTLAGIHLRARGEFVGPAAPGEQPPELFQFAGSGQTIRIELRGPVPGEVQRPVQVTGRIDAWQSDGPVLRVL
ncbi:MAG: hypothetical protein WAT39_17690 [Planctomycetota bacterium]